MSSIAFCVAEKKGKRNNILFPKRHIVTETVCTLADVINGYVRTYFRLIFCIAGDFDGTIADTSQYSFILILCEGCESPGFGIGRKADVISVFQSKLLSSSAKFREVSAEVGIQSVVDGAWKTFHSGSQAALADFGTLVNVYTNNFSVVCLSCIQSRCPDTAAAGEYNLCSVCIPALHTGSNGVIAVELAAIVIFYVYIYAVFFSSSVDTLYITVTETDNGRNSDTAKETKAATVDTGFRTVLTSGLNNFVDSPEILEEMYNYVNELSDRTSYLLGFHAEYTTSGPLLEAVAKLAEKYHSPVWTHNAETKSEVEGCKERWGLTPTQLMERLGMFQYGGGGYHCIWMEDRDFEIFRDRKLTAVTNPSSNLKLASGICPLKRFYDNGINLAIGTDGPASNNCLDMFREMFLTTGLSKVREMDAAGIPADAILYMATAGGAHAMQIDDCDRLAVGKKADLVMIDLHQPNMQPENNLIKNLVYSGSKQNVKLTMVNGQILYENGEFRIGFDPEEIYARSNAIIRRISGSHADN